jgi:hypothetical protein
MRFDLRQLRFRQPEMIPIHRRLRSEAVNHNRLLTPTLLWVRAVSKLTSSAHFKPTP